MAEEMAVHNGVKLAVFLVIGFFVLIFLFVFFPVRIINAGEIGVLLEFGRVKEIWHPGMHILIPFMNDVVVMSTQIEKFETSSSAASSDLQMVSTMIAVNYRLPKTDASIQSLYENFRGDHEIRIIQPLVQEVVKANTAKYTAEELLSKREQVKAVITQNLKEKLLEYDVDVVEVSITNFDFSPDFNKAIESKVVVQQELLQAQLELQKKQIDVQRIIVEQNASATAIVIKAEADAQAQILRANAEAQAIQTITASLNDPYIRYLYVQNWNGQVPKVVGSGQNIIDISSLVAEPTAK
ncbi:SPFH domain / Band 7 family protein [Candidatus Bilamarchaeum dharawalense]|uniref:SPFH domain / Band 7 family protein n=1 Tax=Candidatus Bilamarchaeum dharawalense TaxID=2885759 RepID=A0A5E4LM65_9ARCH|nr:SPFH domain / Band 7 family protein [Candidatus Bilamarchaeum dharawalense]